MNELILNDRRIETDRPPGLTLLDFVRYEQHLTGTKIGCREGDCGACTMLLGSLVEGTVRYQSVTSCLAPLGSAFGKHVVTIDGLEMPELSPVQSALVEEGGTQCGFCTPGFAVSLTGFCLSGERPNPTGALASIDGNICRCTGYKSIERAAYRVVDHLTKTRAVDLESLVSAGFLPDYFLKIPTRLEDLPQPRTRKKPGAMFVGGGTDLYVQRPDEMEEAVIDRVTDRNLTPIKLTAKTCRIGATATVTDLWESAELNQVIPNLQRYLKWVSSTPIRNMGTIVGNLVNASPIGDLTILMLALDASLKLRSQNGKMRTLALRDFYEGYKKLAKEPDEIVEAIEFKIPKATAQVNFEKVSKRRHLDIASVNSAMLIALNGDQIEQVYLSAGGIGPIPAALKHTESALIGKPLTLEIIKDAAEVLPEDSSPISDARGTAEYKSLLLRQLFYAHFIELFPDRFTLTELR